jgi:hypothetical protein
VLDPSAHSLLLTWNFALSGWSDKVMTIRWRQRWKIRGKDQTSGGYRFDSAAGTGRF